MLKLIALVLLTLSGTALLDQARPIQVESNPLPGLHRIDVPKPISAASASVAEIKSTFQAPVVKASPAMSGGDIESIVRQAARKYGLDEDHFVQVAKCESGLTPSSINHNYYAGGGNPSGLFQFLPETWNRMSSQSGVGGDVFNATANANVAAWAWANGHSGEWECR